MNLCSVLKRSRNYACVRQARCMYTYFNMCLPFAVDEDDKEEMPMNANTQLPDEWSLVPWEYTAVCRYWAHMIITCGSAVSMPVGIGRVFHGYRNLFLGSEVVYGAWNQLGVIMEAIGSDGGPTVFYTAVPSNQFPEMSLAGAICRTHGFGYIFLKQDVAEVDARAQNQWGEDELGKQYGMIRAQVQLRSCGWSSAMQPCRGMCSRVRCNSGAQTGEVPVGMVLMAMNRCR